MKRFLFFVLMFVFLGVAVALPATDKCNQYKEQIAELRAEIEALETNFDQAQELIALQEAELSEIRANLEIALTMVEAKTEEISLLQADIDKAYDVIGSKNAEIVKLQNEIDALKSIKADASGMWFGITTGYPWGAMGTFGYQFNENWQITSGIGYMGQFQIQVGLSRSLLR